MRSRLLAAAVVVGVLAGLGGAHPQGPDAAPVAATVTPAVFESVANGIAQVRTVSCNGKPLSRGTGFMIGKSVVMTTRSVLSSACAVRVTVNGKTLLSKSWAVLSAKGVSDTATDLATIRLSANAAGVHVFRIRGSSPSGGTSVAIAGYPSGTSLVLSQGKVAWTGKKSGAPLLGVRTAGGRGADGAPFVDDAGLVAGVVQVGRGARDVPGSHAGVYKDLDLTRWWPPAKADICRIYTKAGILSCASSSGGTTTPTPAPGDDRTGSC